MNIPIITVCSDLNHTEELTASATKNGWKLIKIKCEWQGFSTKIIELRKYLEENTYIKRFIFCDAYDVLILGTPDEFKEKLEANFGYDSIVFGAERGCWPDDTLRSKYLHYEHGFNFLNSGLYYANTELYLDLLRYNVILPSYDDQYLFSTLFLDGTNRIKLDTSQILFNNHSFIRENEYGYDNGRVQILGNKPVCLHKNGRTVDEKLNQMLGI